MYRIPPLDLSPGNLPPKYTRFTLLVNKDLDQEITKLQYIAISNGGCTAIKIPLVSSF